VFCLGPRGRTQTNVYFVRSGSSWVLIDAGWAKDGPSIREAAESVFGAGTRPAAILLTHSHPDHAGAARELARTWDRPVHLHPIELPSAQGDFVALRAAGGPLDTWIIVPLMRAMGRRRRDSILAGSSLRDVAQAFDPAALPGLPEWECVATPGHTPGHASFFRPHDRVLISGDALVTVKLNSVPDLLLMRQGLSGPPWYTTGDWAMAKGSVEALARLEPSVLAGGHGRPMTGAETASAVGAFAEVFSGRAMSDGPVTVPAGRGPRGGRSVVNRRIGRVVLGLSSLGLPLTQLAMRRLGPRGAMVVEAVCGGLLVRDAAMLAAGAPRRLRRGPAALLWLETLAGATAVLAGIRPVLDAGARERAQGSHPDRPEALRRAAVGVLFGLHTVRYRIYLQPDHGLRQPSRRPSA
jgi:glyoxylase-like metal-dependent hydrolase (beta-lactamase superfamily II)